MKFKSKIDWWMHLVLASMPLANIWVFFLWIQHGGIITLLSAVFILLFNVLLIMPLWIDTHYVLDDRELRVRCRPLINERIPYASIKTVQETRSPLASAALSLDRIEITYGMSGRIMISPQNKQEFLRQLKQRTVISTMPCSSPQSL
jgi:membrane protein YdbS with pleckstrin-like domain